MLQYLLAHQNSVSVPCACQCPVKKQSSWTRPGRNLALLLCQVWHSDWWFTCGWHRVPRQPVSPMAFALSSGAQLRVPACRSHRRTLAVAPRPLDTGRHVRRVALQQRPSVSTSSVDPMASRTEFEVGFTMPCHSEEQVNSFLNDGSGRLVVIMCKSSHCK